MYYPLNLETLAQAIHDEDSLEELLLTIGLDIVAVHLVRVIDTDELIKYLVKSFNGETSVIKEELKEIIDNIDE